MEVKLINNPSLEFVDSALGQCWDRGCYIDIEKRDKRIKNNALKLKHESVLEFANYIFEIEASTKVLLEMTRHRMASFAVKSSRYTLNKGEVIFESSGDDDIDQQLYKIKLMIEDMINLGKSNDLLSLMLPQAYQYRWQVMFNARSLKNFLKLRTNKAAHFQIRKVAHEIYQQIPKEYKYIFEEDICKE